MDINEAESLATRFNKSDTTSARVVRILPESIDPIQPGDDGWDVAVTYYPDFRVYED